MISDFARRLRERRPPWRRVAVAASAFLVGVAVVVVSAERAGRALGPWSGFLGMIGLIVLVAGLVQGDLRVLGASAAVIGTSAAISEVEQLHGVAGSFVTAGLGAALLLVVELGQWSAELRYREDPRRPDPRRVGMVVTAALGGGAIGGLAVTIATATPAAGSLVVVVAGAIACCLLVGLALLLVVDSRS